MKRLIPALLLISQICFSQTISQKLDDTTRKLLSSDAAYSANLSFYVADEDGNFVYEYNGNKGLSTASTQKIFTAAAALETLGKDFQYTTTLQYNGTVSGSTINGDLYLTSNGDPTLGSWRYDGYKPENFKQKLLQALRDKGISRVTGNLIIDDSYFDFQTVPGGWPWNDLGNYYGAGVWGVNWRENQFDMEMVNGKLKNTNVELPNVQWVNEVSVSGSSDQSLIFTAPHSDVAYINGKLPAKSITVSGAMPNPPLTFGNEIGDWLKTSKIDLKGKIITVSEQKILGEKTANFSKTHILLEYKSPTLDKIIFWFMRKSVNLYGETLIKTLAKEKKRDGSFDSGISYLKDFWKGKGIQASMINFADGSGLSPQNYVSARAEVQALIYSKKQPWFPEFFEGFPTQGNGMKMKSGTMKDTKSFAGYQTSRDGKKYVFAIIINNYQGSNISDALYQVLSPLK
ncbi:D-alanyl-D-alanine carboxypeptidase / D-alanyl-D-alanine-endopeptidase (penicillin-binding protein 4) [Kaistella treverensis]|uniref:D-alanyl-D-alanine carboxypeptidase / D-alanyl-D-alanine-endopeptidase (Penicillin-binding protein 4) n=1 Tax=Kaistella treverensis TaxID=631455 RepID=A0A1I3JPZ0_9FLAO|nr:D-alanyl-D-alanine carboxypeptidase/D-alanyl-D-alanine-endopeptidase [Kaistella treverensis]SFI61975.1 D-alanyl-D-alanine carboxypeptidase / D-alanyl-D-alanine-endopeptidase (penicillin-binding protein 4) [Kaistella treverensis]